jgi:hypothetical protein
VLHNKVANQLYLIGRRGVSVVLVKVLEHKVNVAVNRLYPSLAATLRLKPTRVTRKVNEVAVRVSDTARGVDETIHKKKKLLLDPLPRALIV